jgi:hypothetical protein
LGDGGKAIEKFASGDDHFDPRPGRVGPSRPLFRCLCHLARGIGAGTVEALVVKQVMWAFTADEGREVRELGVGKAGNSKFIDRGIDRMAVRIAMHFGLEHGTTMPSALELAQFRVTWFGFALSGELDEN